MKESFSKFRVIAIYVTTTIVGIVLIFAAVYNASTELEVIHEIESIHAITKSRLQQLTVADQSADSQIGLIASTLSTPDYRVYPYSQQVDYMIHGFTISSADIKSSTLSEHGGYFRRDGEVYTWALVEVPRIQRSLLVTHHFQSRGRGALFAAYKHRLIVPAVFFVWMTVWGALILSNLLQKIHAQKERAEYLARHDTLTGLPNREHFTEELENLCGYSRRHKHSFCIAVVDLDNFKHINDSYGHNAGDEVLKEVAVRFKQTIRTYDVAARLGGDEFILLLPDLDTNSSIEIFERIHARLVEPYQVSGMSLVIGASLGVSVFPVHADSTHELIRKADLAMYRAKNHASGIEVYVKSTDG